MDWVALSLLAAVALGVLVAAALWLERRLGLGRTRCPRCASFVFDLQEPCAVCGLRFIVDDDLGAPAAKSDVIAARPHGRVDPELGYINRRVSRAFYRAALTLMVGGIAVRVLGMLEPVGINHWVPPWIMGVVTVIGGLAAFVGFVVLDFA